MGKFIEAVKVEHAGKSPHDAKSKAAIGIIHKKNRPDYKSFNFNNWKKNNANKTINLIEKAGGAVWLSYDGDIVYRTTPHAQPLKKEASKAAKVLGNLINKRIKLLKTSETDISEIDLIMVKEDIFDPNINQEFFKQDGIWYRNTFRPTHYMTLTEQPTQKPTTILNLIRHLVTYNEEYFNHFINWLAYFWQTMQRPNTAIVLLGEQGTGKGILFEQVIRPLFGHEQTIQINNSILRSNYLAPFFKNKIFYNLDEISQGTFKENKRIKNFIKPLITNDTLTLDEKFTTIEKSISIKGGVLITSNEHIPLEIEPGDRRFNVFPSKIKLTKRNFLGWQTHEAFKKQIHSELEDFARYLYHYEVDAMQANRAIMTPEKRALIQATTDRYTLFANAIVNQDLQFFSTLEDAGSMHYIHLKLDFSKNRIRRNILKEIFNLINEDSISTTKLMKELQLRYPQVFGVEPIKSNGIRYFKLPPKNETT